MAILSSAVSAGDTALASSYNNLRTDLLTGDITIAGVKTFSSASVFSAGLKVAQSQNIYFNTALTTRIYGDDVKLYAYANGTMVFQSHSTYLNLAVDLAIESTKKIYLDGVGGDTYITEYVANAVTMTNGGSVSMEWDMVNVAVGSTRNFVVYSGKKMFFDGGGDTYDIESSANVRDMYMGGNLTLRLQYGASVLWGSASGGYNAPIFTISNIAADVNSAGLKIIAGDNGSGASAYFLNFHRPDGGTCGSITKAGATSVSYNTTSDKRIKQNISSTKYQIDDLLKIKIIDFNFIGEEKISTGMIAQELIDIYPLAVSKGKDDKDMLGIDYGKLTPLIIKALQDLKLKIDNIETRLKQ
jgi:hypothetical protein